MESLVVLKYLLAFALLTALGAPIAALVFRELPRRGAAFALPAALIPYAIVIFWVGQVTFGLHTILLAVGVLVLGSLLAYHLSAEPDWGSVVATYGVFVVGFSIMVVLRASDPSVTPAAGEQFLHFGLVKAIERAPSLPPEDFWYAGKPLQYYYGTQLQVTSFSMLTGTQLRYGFNLGIATFYGVLFVVAYGFAGAIVASRGYSYHLGGVPGAFLVALGGPTTTPIRLLTPHLPDWLSDVVAPAAFGFVAERFNGGDLGKTVAELSNPLDWTWWYTRYVVPETIQEVPLYSFVKADLHGHALSTGYVLFAGAIAYAYYTTPAEARARRVTVLFGGLGATAGVFGFMNTWSLPTAGGLALLAVGAADAHPASLLPERLRSPFHVNSTDADDLLPWAITELSRLLLATVAAVVVLLIGVVVASPFLVFGHVPSNDGIGFFPPRSPLGSFLVIYGGLLGLFAVYVTMRGWRTTETANRRLILALGITLVAMVATSLLLDFGVLAVTGPLLLGGWLLVRSGRGDFALVLLVAGVGLLLSLELVHARLPLIDHPRWNTSLKVAVQGWTLAAAGAGAATGIVLAYYRDRIAEYRSVVDSPKEARTQRGWAVLGSSVGVILVSLVLLASLVFPVMVFGQEVGSDVVDGNYDPTADGLSDLERWRPDEAAAIHWLDDRQGTPTIVEAPGPSYRFTSPASTFTGLPTVVGWDHQEEYRSTEAYDRRVAHVDEIYSGDWEDAASHLKRYDVQYVYVGPNERERYGEELRSFDRAAFSVVFENDAVTIYRVDRPHLQSR